MKKRYFLIEDIDCPTIVEVAKTQKEIFEIMDELIENNKEYNTLKDECFTILYKDGTELVVNEEYDDFKVKKKNIKSIVYNNAETTVVYGFFKMNEFGVITPTCEEMDIIADENIREIKKSEIIKGIKKGNYSKRYELYL